MPELSEICELLDKLALESLTLMEEEIQSKLEMEKSMCNGETHLAKTRYIVGQHSISSLQIPAENSNEFNAIAVVHSLEEDQQILNEKKYDLEVRKKSGDDNFQDPLYWFGVLVPQNLHYAQAQFRQALVWAAKTASIQSKLHATCTKISQLLGIKSEVITTK